MNWIVLTDLENDPVLINVDEITCIFTSDDKNSSIIWIKNEEHEVIDVKESLVEIYTQISSPHDICELLDRYKHSDEPIMQEFKDKITRAEKWFRDLTTREKKDVMCNFYSVCDNCPMYRIRPDCKKDEIAFTFLKEEVDP